jgi:hypothetical protein
MEREVENPMTRSRPPSIAQRKRKRKPEQPEQKLKRYQKDEPLPARRLYRRNTAAQILDCAVDMLRQLEKQGKLHPIRLNKLHVFYAAEEVDAIARGE